MGVPCPDLKPIIMLVTRIEPSMLLIKNLLCGQIILAIPVCLSLPLATGIVIGIRSGQGVPIVRI